MNSEHIHDGILCPGCRTGYVHKLKEDGIGRVKCTYEGCGSEYALIPINADYQCEKCNAPHKKPTNPLAFEIKDICPFCGNTTFKWLDEKL